MGKKFFLTFLGSFCTGFFLKNEPLTFIKPFAVAYFGTDNI